MESWNSHDLTRMSDYCQEFFRYIMSRISDIGEMMMMSIFYTTNMLSQSLQYQITAKSVRGQICCTTRTLSPDSAPTSLCSFACLSKKQQIQISSSVVLGLTRPGLEHTAYFTPGEDANHYTTATVILESYIAISYIYRGHKNYRFVI